MTTLLFDTETNGLLPELDRIHCISIKAPGADEPLFQCNDHGALRSIEDGLFILAKADTIVAHNAIGFDMQAIEKVYPWWRPKGKVRDTLLMSRLLWPDLYDRDCKFLKRHPDFPKRMMGKHGLEAWGRRMHIWKGDYKAECRASGIDPWAEWSPAMQSYCDQDVFVLETLWTKVVARQYSERAVEMEHRFAELMQRQERHGFPFDVSGARSLYTFLSGKRNEIEAKLSTEVFPPWWANKGLFVPKRDNGPQGYTKGAPITRVELHTFNPSSRVDIADRLVKLRGWRPQEFTPEGRAKVDETILADLPYPEAAAMNEYLLVDKRIGQLAEGDQAWLKVERDGIIHGGVLTLGAITRRCSHIRPNVSAVPATKSKYGKECRSLFTAAPGYLLVGADAAGIELRCLAHYMHKYDGGVFAASVVDGNQGDQTDPHSLNAKALGFDPLGRYVVSGKHTTGRNIAKVFIYAYLYGAGLRKLALILGCTMAVAKRKMTSFIGAFPALAALKRDIDAAYSRKGTLTAIDGGVLQCRHKHALLNTLLQSAAGIAMKLAAVILWDKLTSEGYVFGDDYAFVAHIHDEYQLMVKEDLTNEIGELAVQAITESGNRLSFKCPLAGDFKVGRTWADTH